MRDWQVPIVNIVTVIAIAVVLVRIASCAQETEKVRIEHQSK